MGSTLSVDAPSWVDTLGHKLVVALIGFVVMSAVMAPLTAPRSGEASASRSPHSVSGRSAPLTTASAVTLGVRLLVSDGDGPVRAEVTDPGPIALRAKVRGTRAPGGPSATSRATPVGTLSIGGPDRPGVSRVSVMAYLHDVGLEGGLGFEWRMLSAPAGSGAALTAPDTASPVIQPDLPGTYDLQVTVRDRPTATSAGPGSEEPVVLTAKPDDPPIGVPIETLSSKPGGHIQIDDQPVAGTADPRGIYFAVLDRASRAVEESGTVTPDTNGVFSDLQAVRHEWSTKGTLAYFMVVSSATGGDDLTTVQNLSNLVAGLGYKVPTADYQKLVKRPFSFLGLIGAAPGTAWGNINSVLGPGGSGNITGFLRVTELTGTYDLVDPRHPTIDTQAAGTTDRTSIIRVGDTSYTAALPAGAAAGLHVLALNPYLMLAPLPGDNNRAWVTNGSGGQDVHDQGALATYIAKYASDHTRAIFIIQGIGQVRPRVASLGTEIGKLGGNPAVFNALNSAYAARNGSYALIGRAGLEPADVTAESSSSAGQPGHLDGVLGRDRSWSFGLIASDPSGSMNTDLLTIADQPAEPFPAFDTPGTQAADDYIARKLKFCPEMPRIFCDLRRKYYENPLANWDLNHSVLRGLDFEPDQGFTADEFQQVKKQLSAEVADVARVFDYLTKLSLPFNRDVLQSYVDLQNIGTAVNNVVKPPSAANITANGLTLVPQILSYANIAAGFFGQPHLKVFLDVVTATIELAAFLSTSSGAPAIGVITAKTTQLASELLAGYRTSELSITGAGLLIVSDYGRLEDAASRVNGAWSLPPHYNTRAAMGMRAAAMAWFYQTLLPLAYKYYQISPPPPSGPTTPQSLECIYIFIEREQPYYPLKDLPGSAQTPQIVGFENNGVPIPQFVLIAGNYEYPPGQYRYATPPASLTDPLFAPFDPNSTSERPGLGLNKLAFYSGPTWPKPVIIRNRFDCKKP